MMNYAYVDHDVTYNLSTLLATELGSKILYFFEGFGMLYSCYLIIHFFHATRETCVPTRISGSTLVNGDSRSVTPDLIDDPSQPKITKFFKLIEQTSMEL